MNEYGSIDWRGFVKAIKMASRSITSNMLIKMKEKDSDIINKLKKGSHAAFEELFRRHADHIYHFALRYYFSEEEAEDIVQEVFFIIWEKKDGINLDCSFESFLFTICRNMIYNKLKRKVHEKKFHQYLNTISTVTADMGDEYEQADLKQYAEKLIDNLPPQRKRIFLFRQGGLSNKEIAVKLNLSVRTIEAHMKLAIDQLKKSMRELMNWTLF
jgi:RNA polymerase sigma-70 factor (family 1)